MRKRKYLYRNKKNSIPSFSYGGNLFRGGGLTSIAIADKSVNPWDYTDDGNTILLFLGTLRGQDYLNSRNWLGIKKKDNPFSNVNLLGEGLGSTAAMGALGVVSGTVSNLLSGGHNSTIGGTLLKVGGITKNIPIPIVNKIGMAAEVVGGLYNGLLGDPKVDEAKLNAAEEGTALLNNTRFTAGSTDDLAAQAALQTSVANVLNPYTNSLFGSGAGALNAGVRRKREEAQLFADRSFTNAANNIFSNQINDALANYSALGGDINIIKPDTPIGYSILTDKFIKDKQKEDSNMTNMFAGTSNIFADGSWLTPELKKRIQYRGYPQRTTLAILDINNIPGAYYTIPRESSKLRGSGIYSIVDRRDVDTRSDSTRRGKHEGNIPYNAGRNGAGEGPLSILEAPVIGNPDIITGAPTILPGRIGGVGKMRSFNSQKLRDRSIRMGKDPDVKVVPDPDVRVVPEAPNVGSSRVRVIEETHTVPLAPTAPPQSEYIPPYDYNNDVLIIGSDPFIWDNQLPSDGVFDMFKFGGGINTKGANFDTGISFINAGGSHEENPNEGVLMGVDSQGVPNLVEEGEVRWGDYIFSDRLIVPRGKRGNYGKRARKYAEGGTLMKGKGIDTPYESKVLKPFEGLTFAEAAKKILKRNGADERDDAITIRGIDAQLSVLAGILEKEREKEKLREIQETIDNMSPEEFAMLQQQMEAQQAALQQQEMAMQQLQMIPEGMELMQPVELQQPIAALGGLLNSENEFKYGGSLEEFTKDLQNKGLTVKDYFDFLYKSGKLKKDEYEMALFNIEHGQGDISINEDNFNKDWAESYINSINSKEKEVARLYRKNGKDPKKLEGAALQKYQEDVLKATKNPELLTSDTDKQLFVNQVGKGNNEVFSRAANDAVTKEARQAYFGNPMVAGDNGKFAINYGRPEGVAEDWKPQSADIIKDALQFKDGTFVDSKGNVVDNPFEGYDITTPTRDWSTYGYLNPTDNTWTNVEYNPSTEASGNTDYRYTPWNEWFKDSKMDADAYEAQDAYLNNYLDFLDDIYAGNQDALQRLYRMGEASKSSKLPENMQDILGKNRYFNTDREGFDSNNLTLDDIRVFNGNKVIGEDYITGIAPNQLSKYNDRQFYKDKNGIIHWDTEYNRLSDTDKKAWTALPYKGLKREDLVSQLKGLRNVTAGVGDDLLFASMFDNNPALSYLMANRAANRYALVDDTGAYVKDANGNILYLNSNVVDNPLYSIYNNGTPIETNTLGDTSVNTIGVRGGNLNPHIAVVNGKYYNLTPEQALQFTLYKVDPEKAKSYTGFDTPITGYSVNPTYYEIPEEGLTAAGLGSLSSALGTKGNGDIENDPFPKASTWPYLTGIGLLGLSLLYNWLTPTDYSNADAMIKASLSAGTYNPIEFRPIGNYLTYRPDDPWFYTSPIIAQSNSTQRALANKVSPSKGAETLANSYATMLALGQAQRLQLDNNFNKYVKVGEYNKDTDKFNSEGFLKADMANQDAATRAAGYTLEGKRAAYAMRLAIDDAKANAISAGLSGLGNLAMAYGLNKWNLDVLGWKLKHNQYPISLLEGYKYDPYTGKPVSASKGGKLKKRHRGLGF